MLTSKWFYGPWAVLAIAMAAGAWPAAGPWALPVGLLGGGFAAAVLFVLGSKISERFTGRR